MADVINAFDKSIRTAPNTLLLSTTFLHLSIMKGDNVADYNLLKSH